jgi:serine/threonine protein kinase
LPEEIKSAKLPPETKGLDLYDTNCSSSQTTEDKKYAVKIIRSRDEEYQNIALKEFEMLKSLDYPNIIKAKEVFCNYSRGTIYLVMELVKGSTLKKFMKKQLKMRMYLSGGLPESECKHLIK